MTNKITIAVLAITAILMSSCQLDTGNHFSEKESLYNVEEIEGRTGGGTLIVGGDISMLVNTGSSLITLDRVEVHDLSGTHIATFPGCNNHECRIDISSLSAGTYEGTAYPSIGSSFSAQFTLNN